MHGSLKSFLILSLLCTLSAFGSTTYYVDATGGSDGNNGTSTGTPWKTLARLTNSFSPGDFILLKRGESWNELLTPPTDGTSVSPITFGAYSTGLLPTLNAQGVRTFCVDLQSRSNIVVDSIKFINATSIGIVISRSNNVVQNCIASNCYSAILVNGNSSVMVSNCVISGCTNEALGLHDVTYMEVHNCTLTNNVQGINDSVSSGRLLVYDTYFSNTTDDLYTTEFLSVYATRCRFVTSATVSHCINLNNGDSISYCIIDMTAVPGYTGLIFNLQNAGSISANNCVFYGGTGAAAGQFYVPTGHTMTFTNCIFTNIWKLANIDIGGACTMDHCMTNTITLGTLSANTSKVAGPPLFTSASTGDFTLQAGSPAIDAGVYIGITTDLAGNPVQNPPDIGAFEFSLPSNNILENGGFECGNLRGWSYSAYSASEWVPLTFDTNTVQSGTHALRLEFSNLTNATLMSSRLYRLTPSTAYTLTFYAKGDPTNTHLNEVDCKVYNSRIPPNGGGDAYDFGGIIITTNWARYTNTFTTTNIEGQTTYYINIGPHWGNGSALVYPGEWLHIDSIQLEQGSTATAFAPMTPVELGCEIDGATPGHVYTNSPVVHAVAFNNTASSSNITVNWKAYNQNNASVGSGTSVMTVGATSSVTNAITMPSAGYGSFRCLLWVTGISNSVNEVTYGVVPVPVTLNNRTNSTFGTDVLDSDWSLNSAQRMGIHWNRHLSVNQYFRWTVAEAVSNVYVYYTNNVARNTNYGIEPVANLGAATSGSGARSNAPMIPDYATNNVDYWPDNTQWSNFTYNVVGTYKPWVHYWEIFNEIDNTNQFTNVMIFGKGAARAADANSILIAPVDFYWLVGDALYNVLGDTAANIWATHIYPDPSDYNYATNTSVVMVNHSKPGWNTETGFRSDSFYATQLWEELQNSTSSSLLPNDGGYTRKWNYRNPYQFNNFFDTQVGVISKYFYYEMRSSGGFDGIISYSMLDFPNTIKPSGSFFAALASIVDGWSGGKKFTINSNTNCWWGTNNTQCIVALEVNDFASTNACVPMIMTTSMTTNQFTAYDSFGNAITYGSGIKFGRVPIILVGAVGVATNTVLGSLTITASTDTAAPNLSIVTFPTTTSNLPPRFTWRWTAFDDCSLETWLSTATNGVLYSYKLDPADSGFSVWTNNPWATYTNLSYGTAYTMYVRAKDASGNTVTNQFPESSSGAGSGGTMNTRYARVGRIIKSP